MAIIRWNIFNVFQPSAFAMTAPAEKVQNLTSLMAKRYGKTLKETTCFESNLISANKEIIQNGKWHGIIVCAK